MVGSREALLGEVVAHELELLIADKRRRVSRRGPEGLLEVFDLINRSLSTSTALRRLLEQERTAAMRLLTASDEPSCNHGHCPCVQEMIDDEAAAGRYQPPADPRRWRTRSSVWPRRFCTTTPRRDRGDRRRLHDVEAALLGVAEPPRS